MILGLYAGLLTTLATIVEFEIKKRESDTSAVKLLARNLITGMLCYLKVKSSNETDENHWYFVLCRFGRDSSYYCCEYVR